MSDEIVYNRIGPFQHLSGFYVTIVIEITDPAVFYSSYIGVLNI